jgi:hypothetical protein
VTPVDPVAPVAPVAPAGPPSTISRIGAWLVVTLSLLSRNTAVEVGMPSITNPKFWSGAASQLMKLAVTSTETNCPAAGTVTVPATDPCAG